MMYKTISDLDVSYVAQLVKQALVEDAAHDDINAKLITKTQTTEASILTPHAMKHIGWLSPRPP